MSKYCKNCGVQLALNVKFCDSCGAKTSVTQQQEAGGARYAPNGNLAPAAKRSLLPTKKIAISALAAVFVLVLSIGILPGLLEGGGNYPFKTGAIVEAEIKNEPAGVGNASKDGWELKISQGTFDEDVKLTMNILSEEKAKDYTKEGFVLYGTPVELSVEGRNNVRLKEPVTATLQIPKDLLKEASTEELFFGYFYDGKWEYYIPESVDLEKGTATFMTYHFSYLGFGKPSEQMQIETYAKTIATQEWVKESQKNEYMLTTSKQFDDLFLAMGVTSKAARSQLAADVISYIDPSDIGYFDFMAQNLNAGFKGEDGKLEFENKYKELLGKAIYQVLDKNPSSFADKVNIVGNLASAAGSLAGGDTKAAMESIANMLNSAVPISQLAASTSAYIAAKAEEAIDYWAAAEIEKAYQVYATGVGGKWGYEDGLKGDFETIFTLLGGGDRQMDIKIIRKYCEQRGIDENDLTQAKRNEIIANAKQSLKKSFDSRIIADAEIGAKKVKEETFIAELKKEGLLSAYSNQKYFGIDKNGKNFDITTRLNRLYTIKAAVLGLMDKDQAASISEEFLARAVSQWIYWNEKGDRESFYKYMREMGYIKESIPEEAEYAEVLTGNSTKSGTGTIEMPDEGIKLVFTVTGGNITEATDDGWKSKYFIKGTVRPGETISIAVSGNGTNFSSWHHVNEDKEATMSISFEGSENRELITIAPGDSGSLALSYVVPDNVRTVKAYASIGNVWINPFGGGSRTLILNIEFEVKSS